MDRITTIDDVICRFAGTKPGDWAQHIDGGWIHKDCVVPDPSRIRVFRNAALRGGEFHGGVFYGGAFHGGVFYGGDFLGGDFLGGAFYGGMFRGGVFSRTPLLIYGSRWCVAEGADEQGNPVVTIGCETHDIAYWLEHASEISDKHRENNMLDEYRRYLQLFADTFEARKKN